MSAWELLVDRYKDDRSVCNCRQAWYARIGSEMSRWNGERWVFEKNDNPRCCTYGCDHNQRSCKEEIGKRVVEELGL